MQREPRPDHDLRELTRLVEQATDSGCPSSEFLWVDTTGFEAEVERGRVTRRAPVVHSLLTVRVWSTSGAKGTAAGPLVASASLVEQARARAERGRPANHTGPMGSLKGVGRGLSLDDRRWSDLTPESRVDVLTASERASRAVDRRVQTHTFSYRDERTCRRLVNSRGLAVEEWSTRFDMSVRMTVSGPSHALELEEHASSRNYASIASLPTGANLARRAINLVRSSQIDVAGPVRVMSPPRVTAALVAVMARGFAAEDLENPTTFWGGVSASGVELSRKLHLVDDGALPGGLRTRRFDDRGVPPVPLTLLREGEVGARLLDPPTARRAGVRPTGHSLGSALRPSNLVLRSGTRSMNALFGDHRDEQILLLDHVHRAEIVDGVLHLEGSGWMIRSQTPQGAVVGVHLAGDMIEVLSSVVAVASDTDRVAHVDAPGLLLDGLVVV